MTFLALVTFLLLDLAVSDVRIPPNLLGQPQKEYIFEEHQKMELPCVAEVSAGVQIEYLWKFNQADLPLQSPGSWQKARDSGTIYIEDVTLQNEGYYQCFARATYVNIADRLVTVSTVAHLQGAKLTYASGTTQTYTKKVGESLMLGCQPGESVPEPIYSWTQIYGTEEKGDELQTDKRIQIDMHGNLHYAYLELSDNRPGYSYSCFKYNTILKTDKGGSLSVVTISDSSQTNRRPEELFHYEAKTIALKGQTKILRCFFGGYPLPEIVWTRTDSKTFDQSRVSYTNEKTGLQIKNIAESDEIGYKCEGTNSVDSENYVIDLKVEAVPTFKIQYASVDHPYKPENINKTEGEAVTFYCVTDAIPTANVRWYINAERVEPGDPKPRRSISADGLELTIIDLCKDCGSGQSDLMIVQCNASNTHGYAYGFGYLNVLLATKITVAPMDVSTKDPYVPAEFHCEATSDESTPVSLKWKHNNYEIDQNKAYYELSSDSETLTILFDKSSKPNDLAGTYTCEVTNKFSVDSKAATLKVDFSGPVTPGPIQGAGVGDYWWVFVLVIIFIALVILIIVLVYCFCCMKGDYYAGKIEDKTPFIDVRKDIYDMAFLAYERPDDVVPSKLKDGNASIDKSDSEDDRGSLDDYGEPDYTKFNEDGSFMHLDDQLNAPYGGNGPSQAYADTIV